MKQNRFMRNAAILLFAMALLGCMAALEKPVVTSAALTGADASGSDEVRGVWISFRDYKNAGLCDKSERAFGASADAYFQKLKDDGINTVFFHVVPCNDAIYPSRYLPFSPYMFESKPDYDPLEILVDTAHSYDLSFHAWINPYRRTMDVIYDPAKASSTNRIVRIVKEILKNYDVDGIHFDDYFYPARTKGAQLSGVSVAKRKAVINKMVKKVYRTVKDYDEDLLFGISPAGNIAYADSIGCDLKAWMSRDGYIDYIVPQIYWSDRYRMNGKMTKLYSSRLDEWLALNKNGTPMYVGLGLYRGGSKSSSDIGWSTGNDNIVAQIKQLRRKGCEGFVLFSSSSLYDGAPKKEAENYRDFIRSELSVPFPSASPSLNAVK